MTPPDRPNPPAAAVTPAPETLPPAHAGGLWRATPPAVFPPIMGLFGLGLGWRRGAETLGLPAGLGEAMLGAAALLYLVAATAYIAKLARRPGVLREDLRLLPGRAGLAAASLSTMLLAATLAPHAPTLATGVALAAFGAHIAIAALIAHTLATGPDEQRAVTPVWHLAFVGFIIGPLAGIPLGFEAMARAILLATIPVALAIWAVSAAQLIRRRPPAPLRPLLAIHLAPASLFTTVAALLGHTGLATVFAGAGAAILIALILSARWLTEAGFSPLWGAFTFPLAACAGAFLTLGGGWVWPGAAVLAAATLIVPPVVWRVTRLWATGALAAKTGAARA